MRRERTAFSGVLLAWSFLAVSFSASAQSTKTVSDYFEEGFDLAQKGDFVGAHTALLQAWNLTKKAKKDDYAIAANLGAVELKLGKARDAAEHLAYSLRQLPPTVLKEDLNNRDRLERMLKEAESLVGTVRIQVSADDKQSVNGAEILIGNKLVGRWPLGMDVVFVDPEPKPQIFTARLPECVDATRQIDVRKDDKLAISLTLNCRKDPPWPWFVAGTSLAAVGLGFGIGAAVHSATKRDFVNAKRGELYALGGESACFGDANKAACDELEAADAEEGKFRGLSITGFAVGGAGAAVAVGSMLVWHFAKRSPPPASTERGERCPTLNMSLNLNRSGGGAVITGSF